MSRLKGCGMPSDTQCVHLARILNVARILWARGLCKKTAGSVGCHCLSNKIAACLCPLQQALRQHAFVSGNWGCKKCWPSLSHAGLWRCNIGADCQASKAIHALHWFKPQLLRYVRGAGVWENFVLQYREYVLQLLLKESSSSAGFIGYHSRFLWLACYMLGICGIRKCCITHLEQESCTTRTSQGNLFQAIFLYPLKASSLSAWTAHCIQDALLHGNPW